MIRDDVCKEIAAASLHSLGQGIAWQNLLQKKQIRLGFIGGSVTMGFVKDHVEERAYPQMLGASLRARGYDAQVTVCAEPGMNTMHANLLAEERLLSHEPDIVFIEFSINETTLKPSVVSFESLVRRMLLRPNPPIVCLFVLRNVNDYHCESYMLPIAEHYGLPCVRLRTGFNPAMERGELQWADYADEESHPNQDGHRMLADCLLHLLDAAKDAPETEPRPLPEPWLDAPYVDMRCLHPRDCTSVRTEAEIAQRYSWYFPESWRLSPAHPDWALTLTCRTLILFYEVHFLPEFGQAEIFLDGEPIDPVVLHGNSMYGWGNTRFVTVFTGDDPQTHTVTLKASDGNFYVAALGICD